MSLPVHFAPDIAERRVGDLVEVAGDEAHHAVAVRRLRIGESVALTDGAGTWLVAVVTETDKRRFAVEVREVELSSVPAPEVTVVQALPKGDRGELAVEVLTEIGVSQIVPWAASRSVAVWRGERAAKSLAKWRSTAFQAAKQARRSWFPQVADVASTADVADMIAHADIAVVLHEAATSSITQIDPVGKVLVVVGPEGGLSDDEVDSFTAAGAVAVRMGAEVLRTSTAGVAAVAALLSKTSRWS